MKLTQLLPRLNRLQHARGFKIAASILLVALAVTAFSVYYISVTIPAAREASAAAAAVAASEASPAPAGPAAAPAAPTADEQRIKSALDASQRVFADIAARRASPANVGIGLAVLTGVGLTAIWLGLGLTYLGLALAGAAVLIPLTLIGRSDWAARTYWSRRTTVGDVMLSASLLLSGLLMLAASFIAVIHGVRALLSGSNPVLAVSRNVLVEAVRMKVSLVFILLLVFGLASLPLLLDSTTPLRYRVQSFLQYATGGSFWVIAILTLFFAASTVAFEQRDRQIWQTMTKPVSPWQYILGKWLGVVSLNAVLLAVCCAGIFLFTEYLRKQPADGETVQLVSASQEVSRDRLILETQVLTARNRVQPETPLSANDPEFLEMVKNYIEEQRTADPEFATDQATLDKVTSDLYKSFTQGTRTILAGQSRAFTYRGLGPARNSSTPLTLRYKVDSGSNDPSHLYKLTFIVSDGATDAVLPPQEIGLGHPHTLTLYPSVVAEDGTLTIGVINGAVLQGPDGSMVVDANPDMIVIPPDGLDLYYSAGTYQGNFFRVAAALWIKLAFLAMLAITASTFLSFPVACLIAFSVFLAAEGSGFLKTSLEYYDATNAKGNINPFKVAVRLIGLAISNMFATYNELKPTIRLVDGRLLPWSAVAGGVIVLSAWTLALFGIAVAIFRKRELATYSGT